MGWGERSGGGGNGGRRVSMAARVTAWTMAGVGIGEAEGWSEGCGGLFTQIGGGGVLAEVIWLLGG